METCVCTDGNMLQNNTNITFINDNRYFNEIIFFMSDSDKCNQSNTYHFGGVCQTTTVRSGDSVAFNPEQNGMSMKGPISFNPSKLGFTQGVILARISGLFYGYVQAVFAQEGETWRTSDFITYSEERWLPSRIDLPQLFLPRVAPILQPLTPRPQFWEQVWTFPIDEFKRLSHNTTTHGLFYRLASYWSPRKYRERP